MMQDKMRVLSVEYTQLGELYKGFLSLYLLLDSAVMSAQYYHNDYVLL